MEYAAKTLVKNNNLIVLQWP